MIDPELVDRLTANGDTPIPLLTADGEPMGQHHPSCDLWVTHDGDCTCLHTHACTVDRCADDCAREQVRGT